MPYALICTTASKAGTTGGSFADSLSANANDNLTFPTFNGEARLTHMWGIDSDSVMELEVLLTRYESIRDQQHGVRINNPAVALGGAATNAAFTMMKPPVTTPIFSSDTMTLTVTTTAGDDVVVSYLAEYDDLPGVRATFTDWQTVQSLRDSSIGIYQAPVASGTAGAYGTARALNADDSRLGANKYYALLGCTVQTQVTSVTLTSSVWGGQRIGLPVGALDLDTTYWFLQQSMERNKPLIPVFNGNDASQILVQVADGEASTSPKVDWYMYELRSNPVGGALA
jgi:hypothetical protein